MPTEDLEDLNLIKKNYDIIEQYDFKEIINRVSEKLIQEEGNKTFEKNNYRLAVQPQVKLLSELKENVDLEAEFSFEILPVFELNDFSKISLNKYVSSITDQDIDNVIKKLHNDNKVFNKAPSERQAKKNDRLIKILVSFLSILFAKIKFIELRCFFS